MTLPAEPPRGLREACARSTLRREPLDDGSFRVGQARVSVQNGQATCDCPMGDEPHCLHRLLALGSSFADFAQAKAPRVKRPSRPGDEPLRLEGERLPAEDIQRFSPVLDELGLLVSMAVTRGLHRSAKGMRERIEHVFLAASAMRPRPGAPREAGLGRIARSLERLLSMLDSLDGPDAARLGDRALRELAILRNLSRALKANTGKLPLADIAGGSRSEYVEISSIETQGLGLEAWAFPSGTFGLSAYLAVLGTSQILVRTVLAKGLASSADLGRASVAWAERAALGPAFARGSVTMRDLAEGRFALSGARFAPSSGRLSGSSTTSASARPKLPLDDERLLPFVLCDAASALRLSRVLSYDPLGRPPPVQPLVLLPLGSISPSDFDASTQRLALRFRTRGGTSLATRISFRQERAFYFDNLEVLSRAAKPPSWLFARLSREGGELAIEPITAELPTIGALHLTLDKLAPELEEA